MDNTETITNLNEQAGRDEKKMGLISLNAKWGKEKIKLCLAPETTIGTVKDMFHTRTGVLPKRQKFIGLTMKGGNGNSGNLTDDTILSNLKVKSSRKGSNSSDGTEIVHNFILMGTPEEKIFIDPSDRKPQDLPDVVDDFDLDFNAGSDEWLRHVANEGKLKDFTQSTAVHIMNEPRKGKPLLVLDLDHTLLDFSSRAMQRDVTTNEIGRGSAAEMKRPYMDQFLASAYRYYDLVVWSQTSWRWLETKLTELGMLTNPDYRFCFVLDKTSMFTITSTRRDGKSIKHHVKPLQIIWSKFPHWSSQNTVHIDDLSRNFALNIKSGLKISAFHRKKSKAKRDSELLGLSHYLEKLATTCVDFDNADFSHWSDVVSGKRSLISKNVEAKQHAKK